MNKQSLMNSLRAAALAALAAIPGLSCTYSVSVPAIPATGGYVYVSVNTQPGCGWELSRSGSFLSYYSGRTGAGPGTVILYAAPDNGAARSATVGVSAPAGSCGLGSRSCVVGYSPYYSATTTAVQY